MLKIVKLKILNLTILNFQVETIAHFSGKVKLALIGSVAFLHFVGVCELCCEMMCCCSE